MRKYYLQNMFGRVEEIWLNDDNAAFEYAVNRNKRENANWKAYDERGNLIYGLCICR